MPNYFTGHIDKWLLLSESETDFAILFVRSWIPFNAWYCNNYNSTNDRICIDSIKTDGNQFRARIIALLTGTDNHSHIFRAYVGQLHELLLQHPIPDASTEKMITFKNLFFRKNPIMSTPPQCRRNLEYKTEYQTTGSVRAVIVTRSTPSITKYTYTNTKYDLIHFTQSLQATALNNEQKVFITSCFTDIDPRKKENLISDKKSNTLLIGNIPFINDSHLISQALIEVLYAVRCKLFHGELQPSKDNFKIYEPAYHILRILLNSLR